MRILLCTGDGGGNVPPTVAIAGELVRRGHTLRLLAGPYYPGAPRSEAMESQFSTAGCEVVSPEAASWAKDAGAIPDLNAIPERLMMNRTMALWMPVARPWASQASQQIESFRPDAVLTDVIMPGAGMAAEAAGIRRVVLSTTVPVHRLLPGLPVPGRGAAPGDDDPAKQREFVELACQVSLPHLNAARQSVGLAADDDPWAWEDRADRVIILSSRAFDYPATAYPPNLVYAGSVRPTPSDDVWISPWEQSDGRPLVVVSGTTTGLSGLWFSVFQASANAVVELGMRGVLTIGPLDPQTLPQNEALMYGSFIPHSSLLPHAVAMVTQCGHGATIAALRHGLPMVCAPVFADQPDIAARVSHHGAGIALTTRSSATEFRDAIEAVVKEPSFREAARALQAKLANEDGVVTTADLVEEVVGKASV
jgi:UDP:flavonoid glycosyltransferase YjiC (YdhE family)